MNISDKQIEELAEFAKIELNDNDKDKYKKDLDKLISSLDIVRNVDVRDIEPVVYVHDSQNVFRDDIIENDNYEKNQEVALKNAPNKRDGFIVVPKIIE